MGSSITLRTARRIARLTQEELAERAQVDHSVVSKLETDDDRYLSAHYQTIVNIARVLNVDPLEVFPVPPLRTAPPFGPLPGV